MENGTIKRSRPGKKQLQPRKREEVHLSRVLNPAKPDKIPFYTSELHKSDTSGSAYFGDGRKYRCTRVPLSDYINGKVSVFELLPPSKLNTLPIRSKVLRKIFLSHNFDTFNSVRRSYNARVAPGGRFARISEKTRKFECDQQKVLPKKEISSTAPLPPPQESKSETNQRTLVDIYETPVAEPVSEEECPELKLVELKRTIEELEQTIKSHRCIEEHLIRQIVHLRKERDRHKKAYNCMQKLFDARFLEFG